MNGISIKGIVIALLAVIAGDIIGGIALGVGLSIATWPSKIDPMGTEMLVLGAIVGTITTIIGGYIAASIAKTCYYKNAAILGGVGAILGILMAGEYPLWFNVICFLSVFPAALLGGHLAKSSGKNMTSPSFN